MANVEIPASVQPLVDSFTKLDEGIPDPMLDPDGSGALYWRFRGRQLRILPQGEQLHLSWGNLVEEPHTDSIKEFTPERVVQMTTWLVDGDW